MNVDLPLGAALVLLFGVCAVVLLLIAVWPARKKERE